jgi:hypothetical protein
MLKMGPEKWNWKNGTDFREDRRRSLIPCTYICSPCGFSSRFIFPPLKMPTIAGIKLLVKDITMLSNVLPQSIPQGTKGDKIWNVMKLGDRDLAHETFNMRFDAMFGEDCWDSGGHLQHISRGKYGIGCVCSYLAKIDWSDNFPLDLVEIKLQRLVTELRHIWCVAGLKYHLIP